MSTKGKDLRVCGVVQARVTSAPTVVGSIPTGSESCCSSVVELWSVSDQLFPPQKHSGVVKARVTSGRASRRKLGRSRVRFSLALQEAIAQTKNTRAVCSRRKMMPGWRGEELLRLSNDVGLSPRYSARFSSRSEFVRRESQPFIGSRRGGRCRKHQLHSKLCRRNKLSIFESC